PQSPGDGPPQRRPPDAVRDREPARHEPRDHGLLGGDPARAAVLHHRRPLLDELGQHARRLADHAPVRPLALDRRGRAGRPVGDHGRRAAPPPEHADPARLPEGEPGGPADPLPRAHLADAPALDARRVRRDAHGAAHLDGERRQRSIVLAVQRQPGTNTVEVADAVTALLPTFKAWLPPSVQVEILFDRSQSIRASVRDVKLTMLAALVLVVLVIFAFLRNVSATIIPSLALPLS